MIKSICIYCGANFNGDEKLKTVIGELATVMVANNIKLVFGGGSVGVWA